LQQTHVLETDRQLLAMRQSHAVNVKTTYSRCWRRNANSDTEVVYTVVIIIYWQTPNCH